MSKNKKSNFAIFTEAIGLYFSNIQQFIKYMTFPVLGQVLGLLIVFSFTGIYSSKMPVIMEKFPAFNDLNILILGAIIITLPGIAVFVKAFWEYLVAYGAVNSMLDNMLKSGKVYDFDAHTELIKRRTVKFVELWLILGILSIVAVVPFFWVPAGIIFVYIVLVFQVFTYEPDETPVGCIKKSFNLIKGKFLATFLLLCGSGLLTHLFIPKLGEILCNKLHITDFLVKLLNPIIALIPINDINNLLAAFNVPEFTVDKISFFVVAIIISQILTQYTLPMRAILWGLWYKKLAGENIEINENKKSRKAKRPSEKLMEESHKKYSSKKLDRNILKRAMEKEDD